jgi:hypothetical protein
MVAGVSDESGHKTAHKARDKSYPYVPPDVPLTEVEGEEVGFYEVLYGLAERKAGTPLPNDNKHVRRIRKKLARRMPTIYHVHNSKKWTHRPGNPARWSQRPAKAELPALDEQPEDAAGYDPARATMRIGGDNQPATFDVEPGDEPKRALTKEEKEMQKLQQKADKLRAREEKAAAKRAAKREKVRNHRHLSGSARPCVCSRTDTALDAMNRKRPRRQAVAEQQATEKWMRSMLRQMRNLPRRGRCLRRNSVMCNKHGESH